MLRALAASAQSYGLTLALHDAAERPWSSATFTGARLMLTLDIAGAGAGADPAAWLTTLPEADLPVPGRLVADLIVVTATPTTATLEVLLLET
jgi:hypothetical protein